MSNKKEQKPVYINPKDVSAKDEQRVRQWAGDMLRKHESKFNAKCKNRFIIASGEIEPESIDIINIYPFQNLHWIIYRNDINGHVMWSISLLSGHRMLFTSTYAKL